ncbi:MAG: hypothetical protein Q8N26_10305 [Myxococcales bacterium]|nr:hypothetical protein [Myxococcales bacterium]
MPTRTLWTKAETAGVPLQTLADAVSAAAAKHLGPDVTTEVTVNADEQTLELLAILRITETPTEPASLSLAAVTAKFGDTFTAGDELMIRVFFTPDDEPQAESQDTEYAALTGISSVGAGLWPIARRAIAPLLGLTDDPLDEVVQRALLFTVATDDERGPNFVLRRDHRGALVIKERVVVGQGEVPVRASGRRDLLEGVTVECRRREVQLLDVITGLFTGPAVSAACDGTAFTTAQLVAALDARDVHLARRTAFRTSVERLVEQQPEAPLASFAALVSSEREARFIPA